MGEGQGVREALNALIAPKLSREENTQRNQAGTAWEVPQ